MWCKAYLDTVPFARRTDDRRTDILIANAVLHYVSQRAWPKCCAMTRNILYSGLVAGTARVTGKTAAVMSFELINAVRYMTT